MKVAPRLLCSLVVAVLLEVVQSQDPTQSPTTLPTSAPTPSASVETPAPFPALTPSPSSVGTSAPNPTPVLTETPPPTLTPVLPETPPPTLTPISDGTSAPTSAPISDGTSAPTSAPISDGTSAPTTAPALAGTLAPTAEGTSAPIAQETTSPTSSSAPTAEGTTAPTPTTEDFVCADTVFDPCAFTRDLECDAGTTCPPNSDCFDCDPLQQFRDGGCDSCVDNGGYYCETDDGTPVCVSPEIAMANQVACGGGVQNKYRNECSECSQFRFQGCDSCTANDGCTWCDADAACVGSGAPVFESMSCAVEDFSATCPTDNTDYPFPDPFFGAMDWVYELINVKSVWAANITGTGVYVRINDDGVDANHADFSSNFDVGASCPVYLPVALNLDNTHGTTCAALAAAAGNSECSVGIAPDATLSACRIFEIADPDMEEYVASAKYLYDENITDMDVSSNSFGVDPCQRTARRRQLQDGTCPFLPEAEGSPCLDTSPCLDEDWSSGADLSGACEENIITYCTEAYENDVQACILYLDLLVACSYNTLNDFQRAAFVKGVTEGRAGKGIIYMFAAGNEFETGEFINGEGALNTRFTITVGAVGKDGLHASYSTPGAALFISAPGGDEEFYTNLVVAVVGGGCHDAGFGTSFATPVASGVVALVLEANPDLTWRDVQGILATTSQMVDASNPSWSTNAAGIAHSYLYGFGLIDASAAVIAAQMWENFADEMELPVESGTIDLVIPDYPGGPVSSSLSVAANDTFVTESVVVFLNITHSRRGDLDIVLISPSGTESVVHPGPRPEYTPTDENWELMTVRNWGESANGDWTLQIEDQSVGDFSNCTDFPGFSEECFASFTDTLVCADGGIGPGFPIFYPDVEDLTDPGFIDENGIGPADACCICGGGNIPASPVPNALHSWSLVVYGHESDSVNVPAPTPTGSQVGTPPAPTAESAPAPPASSATGVTGIVGLALAWIGVGWLLLIVD